MKLRTRFLTTLVLAGLAFAANLPATTISFTPAPGTLNGSTVPNGFGNLTGLTLSYFGSGSFTTNGFSTMAFWTPSEYSGQPAIWTANGVTAGIRIQADAGFDVALTGFRLGSYLNVTRDVTWAVFDGSFNQLASSGGPVSVSGTPITPALNLNSGNGGTLIIRWAEAFNVGMNSIDVTVTPTANNPIPEPGTLLLTSAALSAGLWFRRRK